MRVLMITGDSRFGPGNPRFELQKSAVDDLVVMYWGRGHLFPKLPSGHFDVVTAQDPLWRGHFAMHVARRIHAKLNLQVHTDLSALTGLKRWWAGFNLRKADSVRVVSERIKQQVTEMGVKAKITVLPVFADLERFKKVVPASHVGKNILWIGRFEEEKNPLQAIAVLKEVVRVIPDAHLTMLGAGRMREELASAAMNLPVSGILSGWRDPVLFLGTADVVLCTSWQESWGASIVEALAAGVPVVAPDVGVAREAGAIIVSRENLAEAVIDVLNNDKRGVLQLTLLPKTLWAVQWLNSLI